MTSLLIDNYDSFTWNVYQYLSELGANVVVYRNDEITLEECIKLNPRNIIISPGPGRPDAAGISEDVIKHFAGKVPILGVCLGEQCMYEVFGGVVTYAGEIVHGKTSSISHDGKGLYAGVPQGLRCTRYHSLAGDVKTLPDALVVTSWTDSKVVMGVRHKQYVMEGVQYHPESIASEHGKRLFWNFLRWEGGTWDQLKLRDDLVLPIVENPVVPAGVKGTPGDSKFGSKDISIVPSGDRAKGAASILTEIQQRRKLDVANAKQLPGKSAADLERAIALGAAPPSIDFVERLRSAANPVALMAEIKRASPSKGNIDPNARAAEQALVYAKGGAAAISVLTEPTWFKGSLEDLRDVRAVLNDVPNRPAILRKEFIVDTYQILEARLYGADTLLLIVAILTDDEIRTFLDFSRMLNMEPMVEVNNAEEMKRAIALGAKVIGVNNRNLHDFTVDMNTTSTVASLVPEGVILAALSGISSRSDVEKYAADGAKAVLVGEALMRATDTVGFIHELLGQPVSGGNSSGNPGKTLVKICGTNSKEAALHAAQSGADFLGLIFAPSPRQVTIEQAADIAKALKHTSAGLSRNLADLPSATKPLLVGVFSNQSYDFINRAVKEVGLDLVQFHGEEPDALARFISVPCTKALHISPTDTVETIVARVKSAKELSAVVLDTMVPDGRAQQGGSGQKFDWNIAKQVANQGVPFFLAGGLTPDNVAEAVAFVKPWAVDVSSGVESSKAVKDLDKIAHFIRNAKS
jgi:anthranilate synthase/indole-3-glycerol phosphate synthase/phosphoribosylanthranilate isomerase